MARSNLQVPAGFVPLNARESDYVAIEVASAYGTAIYPGEPVIAQTDGTVQRTPAGSAAGVATDGITAVVTDILQYKDSAGFVRRNAKYLPASISWTAKHERTLLQCVLVREDMVFRVRADTAAASVAAAISLRFGNADHAYGTADTGLGLSGIYLDISTIATTNTLQWRVIRGLTDDPYNDPTQDNFIVEVVPNLIRGLPPQGESTTGVT